MTVIKLTAELKRRQIDAKCLLLVRGTRCSKDYNFSIYFPLSTVCSAKSDYKAL